MATFGAPATVVTSAPNFANFQALRITITMSDTPQQLPNIPIPDGGVLSLKIPQDNGDKTFISNSSTNVANSAARIFLDKGDSLSLNLINVDRIWIQGKSGKAIEILVESVS